MSARSVSSLSTAVEAELQFNTLAYFVDRSRSGTDNIVICVYENENRHLFYGWGSALGIHLFPPFDRFPYTDATGNHKQNSLSSIRPLPGFDWVGDWTVWHPVDGNYDDEGYEYANVWIHLGTDSSLTYSVEGPLTRHRRRQWTRIMTKVTTNEQIDSSRLLVSSTYNPYNLCIKIVNSAIKDLALVGILKAVHVQLVYGNILMGRTASMPYNKNIEYNETFTMGFRKIDRSVPVKLLLWVERAVLGKPMLVGSVTLQPDFLWSNKNRTLVTTVALVPEKGQGTIDVEITLAFRELFSVEPIFIGARLHQAFPATQSVGRHLTFDNSYCGGALMTRYRSIDKILSDNSTSERLRSALLSASANALLGSLDVVDVVDDLRELDTMRVAFCLSDTSSKHPSHDKCKYPIFGKMEYSSSIPFFNQATFGGSHFVDTKERIQIHIRDVSIANQKQMKLKQLLQFQGDSGGEFKCDSFDIIVTTDSNSKILFRFSRLVDYLCVSRALLFASFSKDDSYSCEAHIGKLVVDDDTPETADKDSVSEGSSPKKEKKLHRYSSGLQSLNTRDIIRHGKGGSITWKPIRLAVNEEHDFVISWVNSKFDLSTLKISSLLHVELLNCFLLALSHVLTMSEASVSLSTITNRALSSTSDEDTLAKLNVVPASVTFSTISGERKTILYQNLEDKSKSDDWLCMTAPEPIQLFLSEAQTRAAIADKLPIGNVTVGLGSLKSASASSANSTNGAATAPISTQLVESDIPIMTNATDALCLDSAHAVMLPLQPRKQGCIKLSIKCVRGIWGVDRGGTSDVYYKIFLLDEIGCVLKVFGQTAAGTIGSGSRPVSKVPRTNSAIPSLLTSNKKTTNASGMDGELFRSPVSPPSTFPSWENEFVLSEEHGVHLATDILIEFWDANVLRSDVCLGECRLSLLTGQNAPSQEHRVHLCELVPSCKMTKVPMRSLGTMYYIAERLTVPAALTNPLAFDNNALFSSSNVIQAVSVHSFTFPGVVLLSDTITTPPPCMIDFSFSGIKIVNVSASPSLSTSSSALPADIVLLWEVLENCKESIHSTQNELQFDVVIPWQQVQLHRCIPMCASMMLVECTLNRAFGNDRKRRPSKFHSKDVVYREISCCLLIGPCPAFHLYETLISRIESLEMRQKILSCSSIQQFESTATEILADIQRLSNEIVLTSYNCNCNSNTSKRMATEIELIESNLIGDSLTSYANGWEQYGYRSKDRRKLRDLTLQQLRLRGYFSLLMENIANLRSEAVTSTSTISTNRQSQITVERHVASILDKVANNSERNLTEKMEDMIRALESDILDAIIVEQSAPRVARNGPHNGVSAEEEFCNRLSVLVHTYYLYITSYFSTVVDKGKFDMMSDPQSKHALLEALISKDDWIELLIGPYLYTCGLKFNRRPLLSYIIDFDMLVGLFSNLLNAEVADWDKRTINSFTGGYREPRPSIARDSEPAGGPSLLSAVVCSGLVPWEVEEATVRVGTLRRQQWVSSIPENIRFQLQIQIGSKRVTPCSSLSGKQIMRIETINARVAEAVVSSYMRLGKGYVQAIQLVNENMQKIQFNRLGWRSNMHIDTCYTSERISRLTIAAAAAEVTNTNPDAIDAINHEEEQLLHFLVACANDAWRILSTHLPQCEKELYYKVEEKDDNESGEFAFIGSDNVGMVLFQNVDTLFKNVSDFSLCSLANVVFLDLAGYFLSKFDELWSSFVNGIGRTTLQGSNDESNRSPVEIVVATLEEFLIGVGDSLEVPQQMELLYICCRRVVLRYLLFIRDTIINKCSTAAYHTVGGHRHTVVLDSCPVDSTLRQFGFQTLGVRIIPQIAETLNQAAANLLPTAPTGFFTDYAEGRPSIGLPRSNSQQNVNPTMLEFSDEERYYFVHDFQSMQKFFTRMLTRAPEAVSDRFIVFCLNNLNNIIRSLFDSVVDGGHVVEIIEDMVSSVMHIDLPAYSPDPNSYDANILRYLGISSLSLMRFQNSGPTNSFKIKISEISCINVANVTWKVYVRCRIDAKIECTKLKLASDVVEWDEPVTFQDSLSEDKDLVIEIVEKLPFRVLRDFPRAELRLPLSALASAGGAGAAWYELQSTRDRLTAWHEKTVVPPNRKGFFFSRRGLRAERVSVELPSGTAGPRADANCAQIRLRIKITKL